MIRTILTQVWKFGWASGLLLITTLVVSQCGVLSAQTPEPFPGAQSPTVSSETLGERLTRLEAEKKRFLASEEEARVRERAEKIRQELLAKEAKASIAKEDDFATAKARKEIGKETKKEREREEVIRLARLASDISCEDPDSVWVHPYAVRKHEYASQVAVRVLNHKKVSIKTIETSYKGIGVAVRDLCAGGGITLSFIMEVSEARNNPNGIGFTLTARGEDASGKEFTSTFQVRLRAPYMYGQYSNYSRYGGRNFQREYPTWNIR